MSNVRNWASTAVVAGLILLAPMLGLFVIATVEMLGDLVAHAGARATVSDSNDAAMRLLRIVSFLLNNQINALRSWSALGSGVEIIVFGPCDAPPDVLAECRVRHERQVATLNGKPLVQRVRPATDQLPTI